MHGWLAGHALCLAPPAHALHAPFLAPPQSHFNIGNAQGFCDIAVVHPTGVAPREARRFVSLASARAVRTATLQVGVRASLLDCCSKLCNCWQSGWLADARLPGRGGGRPGFCIQVH